MPMMYDCVMVNSYLEKLKETLPTEFTSFVPVLYEIAKVATDDFKGIDLNTKAGKDKMFKILKNINKLSKEKQEKIKELKEKIKN